MRFSLRLDMRWFIIALFCLGFMTNACVAQGVGDSRLLAAKPLPSVACHTGADFWIGGEPPGLAWPANLADPAKRKGLVLWGSWCGWGVGTRAGGLELGPFVAPDHFSLLVAGTPFDQGNVLKLVRISDEAQIILTRQTMHDVWKQVDVVLPPDWVGQNVKISAWDVSTKSWLALSEPFVIRRTGEVRPLWKDRTKSLRGEYWWNQILGPVGLIFIIYTLIGMAGYLLLRPLIEPAPYLAPILIRAVTGLVGYLAFWAFFWGPHIGQCVDWGILVMSVGYLLYRVAIARQPLLTGQEWGEFKWCLSLMIVALVFDLGVVGLPRTEGTPFEVVASRRATIDFFPSDNVLQQDFSRSLFNGNDPRTSDDAEWQTSDRPPLQGGLQLLAGPMVLRVFNVDWNASAQMSGVVFQLSWVLGAWALLRAMGCSVRAACSIVLCLMPTPLLYINTIYVWAKLSAAAYVLAMTVLLCFRGKRPLSLMEAATAGVLLALGMLCHSGIFFFALPVLGLWFVLPHEGQRPGLKRALFLIAAAVLLFVPWTGYQKFMDPPGNRLFKLSFAGVPSPNSVPMIKAITDAYKALTPREIIRYKLANFRNIFRGDWATFFSFTPPDRAERRNSAYAYLFRSFGIYLLGLLALPVLYRSQNDEKRRSIHFLLSAVAIAIVIWCLLMFGPGRTDVHLGAYGVPLVLLIVLLYLIRLVHPLMLLIAGLYNLAQFLWVFGWSFPYPPRTDSIALGLLICSFALSILLLIFTPGNLNRTAVNHPG